MSIRIERRLIISKWDEFSRIHRTYIIEKMGTEFFVTPVSTDRGAEGERIHLEGAVAKDISDSFDRLVSDIAPIIRDCVDPATKENKK